MVEAVICFDTTLRDGEQTPGVVFRFEDKLVIAQALELFGVDVIELAFAASSAADLWFMQVVCCGLTTVTACSLARSCDSDVCYALDALRCARRLRLHAFVATSVLHVKTKLGSDFESVSIAAVVAVRLAKRRLDEVEFSTEDSTRSETIKVCRICWLLVLQGVKVMNMPDTVGFAEPVGYGEFVVSIKKQLANHDRIVFSVHCHNDLGLAVANTASGLLYGGVCQIECTLLGLGERAGNAALEECTMLLLTKMACFKRRIMVQPKHLTWLASLVSQISGIQVSPTKPIVGCNVFSHASGIHQDGVIKCKSTYEIMKAEDVGWTGQRIVISRLSGSRGLAVKLQDLGVQLSPRGLHKVLARLKAHAALHCSLSDSDLIALAKSV